MASKVEEEIRRKLSIPSYFKEYIDHKIDLDETSKICCPFHEEDTPSFSYSKDKGLWRCFGKCKTGGDVISMHQRQQGLVTRIDSVKSLMRLLDIKKGDISLEKRTGKVDEAKVEYIVNLNVANTLCRTTDDFIELDYIMGQSRNDSDITEELKQFISNKRGGL